MSRRENPRRRVETQKRRVNVKDPNKTIVIVCEGQKTEVMYFNKFKSRNLGLNIEVEDNRRTDPVNLVKFALKRVKEKYDFADQVWCVFDVDQNSDIKLNEAKTLADANRVEIALSNPCFEVWYLLHFEYTTGTINNADQAVERLQRRLPTYAKAVNVFDSIKDYQQTALRNAEKLNSFHEEQGRRLYSVESNPSTQVCKIVSYIQQHAQQNTL